MRRGDRALWRLAWREVAADRRRNLLVVALLALAVGAAVALAVGHRTAQPTEAQLTASQHGAADLRVELAPMGGVAFDDLPQELQDEARERYGDEVEIPTEDEVRETLSAVAPRAAMVRLDEGYLADVDGPSATVLVGDPSEPLLAGRLLGDTGTELYAGEALASPDLLRELDAGVGDRVRIGELGAVLIRGEVGTARGPLDGSRPLIVVPHGHDSLPDTKPVWYVGGLDPDQARRVADQLRDRYEPDGDEVGVAGAPPPIPLVQISERHPALEFGTDRRPTATALVVAVVALAQVGLVGAATFSTAARRRIRELGLLVAVGGAEPAHLRRLVRRQALLLGVLGAVLGTVVGIIVAWVGMPIVERVAGRPLDGVVLHPADVLVPGVLGVIVATAAAWLPARTVARVPVVAALGGRIPLRQVPRWTSPLAVGMAAAGVALALVAMRWRSPGGWAASAELTGYSRDGLTSYSSRGDGVWVQVMDVLADIGLPLGVGLLLAGGALLAVPLVSLGGRLVARVPAIGRLAIRDSARQRTRSAATVAATMIVLVIPVIVLTMVSTTDEAQRERDDVLRSDVAVVHGPGYAQGTLPPTDDMVAQARELVSGTVAEVRLDSLPGVELRPATTDSEGSGRHSAPPRPLSGQFGDAALATPELLELVGVDPDTDAVVIARPPGFGASGDVLPASGRVELRQDRPTDEVADGVSVDVIDAPRSLGWNVPSVLVPASVAEQLDVEPRADSVVLQRDTPFTEAERRHLWETQTAQELTFRVDPPTVGPDRALGRVFAFAVGGALLVALVIAALTAALAATESDRDLRAMAAIGADPRVRPRFRALQASYHALLAALVALPVGLLLAGLMRQGNGTTFGITVPWGWLLATVPLVVVPIALTLRLCSRASPVRSALRRPT